MAGRCTAGLEAAIRCFRTRLARMEYLPRARGLSAAELGRTMAVGSTGWVASQRSEEVVGQPRKGAKGVSPTRQIGTIRGLQEIDVGYRPSRDLSV